MNDPHVLMLVDGTMSLPRFIERASLCQKQGKVLVAVDPTFRTEDHLLILGSLRCVDVVSDWENIKDDLRFLPLSIRWIWKDFEITDKAFHESYGITPEWISDHHFEVLEL